MSRVITTQAVASTGQFVPAREPGSSKGPRRSETAQAIASAGQFVSATSCINDGKSSARQEHTGRVKARDVRRLHKLHQRWYE